MTPEDFLLRRRRMSLSQKELGDKLDRTPTWVSKIERGHAKIDAMVSYAMDGLWLEFVTGDN